MNHHPGGCSIFFTPTEYFRIGFKHQQGEWDLFRKYHSNPSQQQSESGDFKFDCNREWFELNRDGSGNGDGNRDGNGNWDYDGI